MISLCNISVIVYVAVGCNSGLLVYLYVMLRYYRVSLTESEGSDSMTSPVG